MNKQSKEDLKIIRNLRSRHEAEIQNPLKRAIFAPERVTFPLTRFPPECILLREGSWRG